MTEIGAQSSPGLYQNISGNFAPRFPEKEYESKRREVCSNISRHFCSVLIADIRGFTAVVSDQARATICKS
jgi:hypothetical protein